MATVTNTINLPDLTLPPKIFVNIQLTASTGVALGTGYVTATGVLIDGAVDIVSTSGSWSVNLTANSLITPANTQYKVTQTVINGSGTALVYVDYISVTVGGGTLASLLTAGPPGSLATPGSQVYTDTQIATVRSLVVAASNAPAKWKAAAAYVCTGTNDQTLINSTLTSDSEVLLSPGTFTVALAAHPANASYLVGVLMPNGSTLAGAGEGATIIKLVAGQVGDPALVSPAIIMNNQIGTGGDENITLRDFTVDGNAANQTAPAIHHGVFFLRARGVSHDRVRVQNCRGTASSGSSEAFFFEAQLSSDIKYHKCDAVTTAGSTATGFSADQSTNVDYIDCTARGMTVAHGFTHNACRHITYQICHSYLNALQGFNSEVSFDVLFQGCTAGGIATAAWPFTNLQSLGNNTGFLLNGTTRARLVDCVASKNVAGVNVTGVTALRIIGGSYTDNTTGISVASVADAAQTRIQGAPNFANNTNNFNVVGGAGAYAGEGAAFTPAVPATGVGFTNNYLFDSAVVLTGGSWGFVTVDGVNINQTSGRIFVRAGSTIVLNYSVAPTWIWLVGG